MTNFQRTRSKVWWGDSPPNIGSPIAHASNREDNMRQNEWEPQLPHWVAQRPPTMDDSEGSSPALVQRHSSSPSSHKSQDSGFSDSDSSPSIVQPANPEKAAEDKATTPQKKEDATKTAKTPVRSVIKTPKDVHDYLRACCEIGHASFDSIQTENGGQIQLLKSTTATPAKNINNNNVVADKCDAKKKLFEKSLEDDNIEYISLSPDQQIAVNNQPRVRSPVTRVAYRPIYSKRNECFRRDALNRSFDCRMSQRLDEQLLDEDDDDDDDGPHSLDHIEQMETPKMFLKETRIKIEVAYKGFSQRRITDSLNLKTPKKTTSRTKKIQSKSSKNKSIFNFLPKKNDSIKTIYDITRSSAEADRVPALGLPGNDEEEWVMVDSVHSSNVFNERCIDENAVNKSSPKGILKLPGTDIRKITPPVQFQDPLPTQNAASKVEENFKSENNEIDFDTSNLEACTSTPKSFQSSHVLGQKYGGQIKPVNLLENFNDSLKNSAFDNISFQHKKDIITTLEHISKDQPAPVKHWLCEQIGFYEQECMTTLQSKALAVEVNAKVANGSATITGNIRKVQTHGQIIVYHFNQILKKLETEESSINEEINDEIKNLVANVIEFILAHSITLKIKPPTETPERWDKIKTALQNNIQKVTEVSEDVSIELNETFPEINVLQKHLKTVLHIFIETIRAVLVQQVKTLVTMLEEPPSDLILKSTLTSLGHLGSLISPQDDVSEESEIKATKVITSLPFVECGVPRALLSVIIENNKNSIKALSLRALATICLTGEAVQQFEEGGGIEILSDILNDHLNPEPQMREAITVLTQITAPWLQGNYKIEGLLNYMQLFIKNITALLSKTNCCQLLLLSSACLINLINVAKNKERQQINNEQNEENPCDIIEILAKYKTAENLLEAVKNRGPNVSIFLQEQTATLINLISTSTKGRILLAKCPATTVALVCFLRAPNLSPGRAAQLQAEFRLINQATEALARLCTIPEVTMEVVQLEGVMRLIRVIQAQKSQKFDVKRSDQILVNCLRALRLIVKNQSNCLKEIDCDISNMIRPPLMESVKIYSAKQESYV